MVAGERHPNTVSSMSGGNADKKIGEEPLRSQQLEFVRARPGGARRLTASASGTCDSPQAGLPRQPISCRTARPSERATSAACRASPRKMRQSACRAGAIRDPLERNPVGGPTVAPFPSSTGHSWACAKHAGRRPGSAGPARRHPEHRRRLRPAGAGGCIGARSRRSTRSSTRPRRRLDDGKRSSSTSSCSSSRAAGFVVLGAGQGNRRPRGRARARPGRRDRAVRRTTTRVAPRPSRADRRGTWPAAPTFMQRTDMDRLFREARGPGWARLFGRGIVDVVGIARIKQLAAFRRCGLGRTVRPGSLRHAFLTLQIGNGGAEGGGRRHDHPSWARWPGLCAPWREQVAYGTAKAGPCITIVRQRGLRRLARRSDSRECGGAGLHPHAAPGADPDRRTNGRLIEQAIPLGGLQRSPMKSPHPLLFPGERNSARTSPVRCWRSMAGWPTRRPSLSSSFATPGRAP